MTPQLLSPTPSAARLAARMHHPRARSSGLLALLLVGTLAGQVRTACAWNDFGHMTVAAVAWEQLTPASRRGVTQLLRLNPDYPRWTHEVTPSRRDQYAFVRAATWADVIKGEPGYLDDAEQPQGPVAEQNIGYEDLNEHRYWHYADVPFSPDGTALPPVQQPNVATRIVKFRQVIADRSASADVRSYDLTWLLHLVGDIHQPLHAVSRFTQDLPQGDLGGNRIRICEPPCRRELHYFWDDLLGRGSIVEAVMLASQLPRPPSRLIADTDVQHWLSDSGRIARRTVYVDPVGPGAGPYPLTKAYQIRASGIARAQVALAGGRLAALLNTAFGRHGSPRAPPG